MPRSAPFLAFRRGWRAGGGEDFTIGWWPFWRESPGAFLLAGELVVRGAVHGRAIRREDWLVEGAWTVLPAGLLTALGGASLRLLYAQEDRGASAYGVRIVGHQWFWEHERADGEAPSEAVASAARRVRDLRRGSKRLCETDDPICLPVGVRIRASVTSADVLHSFSLPAVGLKVDAVPGRLNVAAFFLARAGMYHGRCSELCGANHSFMPVCVVALPSDFRG
uniref:cytochrome-c oxidase n=1 Tax=Leucosolenia complicata TaxID=433461 RepID=A0A140CUS9_9METZ|nr:cytochrome c oxidase subunit 2 [Leucosolenia complicata]